MGLNLDLSDDILMSFFVDNFNKILIISGNLNTSSPAMLKTSPGAILPLSL